MGSNTLFDVLAMVGVVAAIVVGISLGRAYWHLAKTATISYNALRLPTTKVYWEILLMRVLRGLNHA